MYLNDVPDEKTLIRWSNVIQPRTLGNFNERIMQLAIERKVTRGRKQRTDGTAVERQPRFSTNNVLVQLFLCDNNLII